MTPSPYINRKNIILVIAAVLVLLVLRQIFSLLTTGRVVVSTDKPTNVVTIREVNSGAKRESTGNTSFRVRAGTYIITVSTSHLNSQQVITIKARETKKVNLPLSATKTLTVEPASSRQARSLVANDTVASFIDASNNNTYMVASDGNEQLIDSDHSFKSISWADPTYGVGRDQNDTLFTINNGNVQPLALPRGFVANTGISFAVAADKSLVISDGKTVYSAPSSGGFAQVYTAEAEDNVAVLGSQNGSTLLQLAPRSFDKNNHGDTDDIGEYALLTGGHTFTHKNLAYEAVLSPDGKHVALSGNGGTSIFDSSFKKIIDIPSPNVISLVWNSTHTILYTINSQLWQYDIAAGKAAMLSDVSDKGPINVITPSQDGKFIYLLIQLDSNGAFSLYRVNPRGQQPSTLMVKLGVFLPDVVGSCSLGYENLTRPTVVVHGPPELQSDCLVKAQEYLNLYNVLDPSLGVKFSPSA